MKKKLMNEMDFTKEQMVVMGTIEKKGEFIWQHHGDIKMKNGLKELYWMDLIERKEGYANVFVWTIMGKKAAEWNKTAKLVNQL